MVAGITALATMAGFLAPSTFSTLAGGVASAGAQTVISGTDCSAQPTGTALSRSGWVTSTNAPSSSGDVPANAIDGNLATRFSTDEAQQPGLYFEVDLGSQQTFDELDMEVPNSPTDFATSYDVEVSTDGTTWTTAASCTGSGTPEVVSFPAQTAQYVMVYLTGTSSYWWSIDEFNLLTSSTGGNCFASVSGTALGRTGWVASTNAPSDSTDAPANALDGNSSTRFSTDETQRPGLYFEVDLGTPQTFDELDMDSTGSLTDYAKDYEVEVSSDGSSWTTVANCFGTGSPEVVSFPAQTAQYVTVELTGTDNNYWWSINEFNLYTSYVPPTTTTTSTTTTSTTPTTTTTPPPPTSVSRKHRFACVTWGWGRFHMGRRVVKLRVCFRIHPLPVVGGGHGQGSGYGSQGSGHSGQGSGGGGGHGQGFGQGRGQRRGGHR